MDIPQSTSWQILGLFQYFYNTAMKFLYILLYGHIFLFLYGHYISSLGCIPRTELMGSCGNSIYNIEETPN